MKQKKVLIVDDDPDILRLIGHILEDEGWTFLSVESGKDAIEAAGDFAPDVVTLDYHMPEMCGSELFIELKKRGLWAPVIFLTSSREDKLVKEFLDMGVFGYLTKPFRKPEIIFILTKAYKYKTLHDRCMVMENKDLDFKGLCISIKEGGSKEADVELKRRILIDRQKAYVADRFVSFYKSREQLIMENIRTIEKSAQELCVNEKCKQVIKELKDTIEDIDIMMSKTSSDLEGID